MTIWQKLQQWDSTRRRRASERLLDLSDRKKAASFVRWNDHGLFREFWTNQAQIAPGVYRSNHPNEKRFAGFSEVGIKTIINLRGAGRNVTYLLEKQLCDEHGIVLRDIALDARRAPDAGTLLSLIDMMREAERPLLMHCKSGADRAGLASAIYLMVIEGGTPDDAKKMLSRRFLHLRGTKTGVLDLVLERYADRHKEDGIAFEDWLRTEYDGGVIQREFDDGR